MSRIVIPIMVGVASIASAHDALNWYVAGQRTCPHQSDMEQRLATLCEAIWHASGNVFGTSATSVSGTLQGVFSAEESFVALPLTLDESQSYFTYAAFSAGLLDMSMHGTWMGVDHIANGVDPDPADVSPEASAYGTLQSGSLYQFLSGLDFEVRLVPGVSYYQCDDDVAWGFGSASVFLQEKSNDPKVCKTARYVGAAQIVTTFGRDTNYFGNDEWMMEEFAVFWDIYSEQAEEKCANDQGNDEP